MLNEIGISLPVVCCVPAAHNWHFEQKGQALALQAVTKACWQGRTVAYTCFVAKEFI